eukprot:63370-Prorocentrum_minimum.AAC.3
MGGRGAAAGEPLEATRKNESIHRPITPAHYRNIPQPNPPRRRIRRILRFLGLDPDTVEFDR